MGPSLITGLDCGLDRWTGLLDWIAVSNQTASKGDDACVAHGTASKALQSDGLKVLITAEA